MPYGWKVVVVAALSAVLAPSAMGQEEGASSAWPEGETWSSAHSHRKLGSDDLDEFLDGSMSFGSFPEPFYTFNTSVQTVIFNDHPFLSLYITATERPAFSGQYIERSEYIQPNEYLTQTVLGHDITQRIFYTTASANASSFELSTLNGTRDSFFYITAEVMSGHELQSQFTMVDLGGHFDCSYSSSWGGEADVNNLVTGTANITVVCAEGPQDYSFSYSMDFSF